ncbi:MAG: sulfate transporter [Halothiobacillaceae bacterium]|nr:MAG: sulfate transporter [Halothiobacillaceae bacterium]
MIILDQLKNLLGLQAQGTPHDHFLYRFWRTLTEGGDIHLLTLAVGLATMVLIILLRRYKNRRGFIFFPEHLLALILIALIGAALNISDHGVKLIGAIPAALPNLQWPNFDLGVMRDLAPGALAIAVLGLLEALSIAKAIAARSCHKLDTHQQCLSEGVANLAGSFFQCIPGSGSFTRSAVNHQAGAVSQWSGVIAAVVVALIILFMAPLAQYIPRAALAGLLVLSVWRMVDWPSVLYHVRATRFDAAIVIATALSAVVISIEFCVLIGVLMSFVLTVPRAGRMQRTEFVITEEGRIHERLAEDQPCCRVLIFGLEGELFFGAASTLEHHLAHIEQRADEGTRVVVLRLKRLHNPDAVGLSVLAGFFERMQARGITVILCGVRHSLFRTMQVTGVDRLFDEKEIFLEQPVRETSTLLAIRYAYSLIGEPCAYCSQAKPSAQPYYFSI